MSKQKLIDVNDEFVIYPFENGIKLHKFDNCEKNQQTIANLLKLPCSVYFETFEGVIQAINERNAEYCGYDSAQNAVGKKYFELLPNQFSELIRKNDNFVMENGTEIFDEIIYCENEHPKHTLSIKTPWYNNDGKVIGLFGMSMVSGEDNFSVPLVELSKIDLLNKNIHNKHQIHIKLSKRQKECAKLLAMGMTSKEIAIVAGLSPRTVEYYVDNIKAKLNCRNKAELVAKLAHIIH